MKFQTPAPGIQFEIPDDWWLFAEMDRFVPGGGGFYPPNSATCEVISLNDIEPPHRNPGVALFKKYKMVPVLFAFASPECALPPITLHPLVRPDRYRFKVHNGFHRFYASIAVGYTSIPAMVSQPFDF